MQNSKKQIGAYLELDFIQQIEDYCADNDMSKAQVVRKALKEYLQNHSEE